MDQYEEIKELRPSFFYRETENGYLFIPQPIFRGILIDNSTDHVNKNIKYLYKKFIDLQIWPLFIDFIFLPKWAFNGKQFLYNEIVNVIPTDPPQYCNYEITEGFTPVWGRITEAIDPELFDPVSEKFRNAFQYYLLWWEYEADKTSFGTKIPFVEVPNIHGESFIIDIDTKIEYQERMIREQEEKEAQYEREELRKDMEELGYFDTD